VLVKDKEVVEAHDNIKFRRKINTDAHFQGYALAFEQGIDDGQKFSISDKIAENDTEKTLELVVGK
jgi:hypothetical protein